MDEGGARSRDAAGHEGEAATRRAADLRSRPAPESATRVRPPSVSEQRPQPQPLSVPAVTRSANGSGAAAAAGGAAAGTAQSAPSGATTLAETELSPSSWSFSLRQRLHAAAEAVSGAYSRTRAALEREFDELTHRRVRQLPLFLLVGDSLARNALAATAHPDMRGSAGVCGPGWGALLAQTYSERADLAVRGFAGYNSAWALHVLPGVLDGLPRERIRLVVLWFGANDAVLAPGAQHVSVEEYASNLYDLITIVMRGVKGRGTNVAVRSDSGRADAQEPTSPSLSTTALASSASSSSSSSVLSPTVPTPPAEQAGGNEAPSPRIVLVTPPPVDESAHAEACRAEGVAPGRSNANTAEYAYACLRVASQVCGDGHVHALNIYDQMMELDDNRWQRMLSDGLHLSAEGQQFVHSALLQLVREEMPELAPEHLPSLACHWSDVDPAAPELALGPRPRLRRQL